ncbi:sialidase family protein [Saccharopolyspora cebuensis]|uniref:exo-alpha-sialidase n=1 Tax=Saccharopolyspora cebuensis TaxID=418759 RepID=A0ABV4CIR2_9PSEU
MARRPRRTPIVLLALSALVLTPTTAQAAPRAVDLAVSDSSTTYRIPAITTTSGGTVVVAYDQRNDGAGDLPGNIDTVVRRSTDSGATWSEPRTVVDYPAPQGCGDPSLLADRVADRLLLFCTFSHGEVGFGSSEPGSADDSDPRTLHVRVSTSEDDGRTWSDPVDITSQIKDVAWAGVFASSGHGVQTADGRLLQPIVVRDAQGRHRSGNIISDDHGRTWRTGELLSPGTDETKVTELSDGRVVHNSRAVGGGTRMRSVSQDGGATFGEATPIPALPDPGVNADEIRVDPSPGGARSDWLLFSNPADPAERRTLTLRLSCDNGETWSDGEVLHDGPAGYSALTMLPDGRVGVFAENGTSGSFDELTFRSVPLELAGRC